MYSSIDCGEEFANLWNEVKKGFDNAESLIKKYEYEDEGLWVPAINQLRYVARHLIDLHELENCDKRLFELTEAHNHIKRALNDVYDAFILEYIERINDFDKDYKQFPVSEVIPNYVELKVEIREIRNELTKTENFEKFYLGKDGLEKIAEKGEKANRIAEIFEMLSESREEINSKIKLHRRHTRITAIIAACAIITLCLTIAKGCT